jgi:hypothetical protein
MITRLATARLKKLGSTFRAVAVVGPRQSGKTTLCKLVFPNKPYVSLENPDVWEYSKIDPRGFLNQYPNGAILDEVQKAPHLFSYLQQILDETKKRGLFILSGSNNFLLQENITQTLAGRIGYLQLLPLSFQEIDVFSKLPVHFYNTAFKGGYPEVLSKKINPLDWYPNYVQTYLERDVRQLKNIANLSLFLKFLKLCAGRTGQILNMASLGNDCGVDAKTIASWLSILQSSFIIYLLKPYHNNFNKRTIKSPKLYFYDTGLCCSLLGIEKYNQLNTHAQKGAIFENMIVIEILKQRMNKGLPDNLFYWRDKTGNEVDLVIASGGKLTAIEAKSGETIGTDFFKGLEYFSAVTNDVNMKILVYNGKEYQSRKNKIIITPWYKITI